MLPGGLSTSHHPNQRTGQRAAPAQGIRHLHGERDKLRPGHKWLGKMGQGTTLGFLLLLPTPCWTLPQAYYSGGVPGPRHITQGVSQGPLPDHCPTTEVVPQLFIHITQYFLLVLEKHPTEPKYHEGKGLVHSLSPSYAYGAELEDMGLFPMQH